MKALIFVNLVVLLNSFQLQAQKYFYKNNRTAWDGFKAYYDNSRTAWDGYKAYYNNARTAWDGYKAYYDNSGTAWDGYKAYYDNARTAWDGYKAYYDNSRTAFDGYKAYYENGQIVAQYLYTQIEGVKLDSLELSELKISDKIQLLTKKLNNKVYVVGLKIQLSEKNAIVIDKEKHQATNIIEFSKDIHFEGVNKKVKLTVLGQTVVR